MSHLRTPGFGLLASSAAIAIACGPTPASTTAAPAPAPAAPGPAARPAPATFDPCEGSPPVPHPFEGILREARCDQDMYLRMASVATQLGVECDHCHVRHPTQPKQFDFPVMTKKKEIANWMSMHLMPALKTADGAPMRCASCHTDADGKPVAKILGDPRDPVRAQEWMSMVLVNRFVTAAGEKLRCKSCHGGNYGTPQWKAQVLLHSEQLPAR